MPEEPAWDQTDWDGLLEQWRGDLEGAGWVTLAEAQAATGVSRSALRAWYRKGELPSRTEEGPHGPQRLVHLESLLERVARSPRLARQHADPNARSAAPAAPATGLQAIVELLATQLERAEGRADRAEAALRDALMRAAAAEAERDLLRRQLESRSPAH